MTVDDLKGLPSYIYLASPYSKYKLGLDAAAYDAADIAAKLLKRGLVVLSPIAHSHTVGKIGRMDLLDPMLWQRIDKPLVDNASACIVAMMDGWEESYGVQHEIKEFEKAGKPIVYIDPKTWENGLARAA